MRTNHRSLLGGILFSALCFLFASSTVSAEEKEMVDYRLTEWKSKHFNDTKKGELHFTTLKNLGCEVKKVPHGDHFDVKYRCPQWRRITLDSHGAAHRWETWLKSVGFETKHTH